MRQIVTAAALGSALALAVTAPAGASVQHRGCLSQPECVNISGNTGGPGWVSVQWLRNDDFWSTRSVAKCGDGTRNTILNVGGWVSGLNTPSETDCTSSFPLLVGAAYDWKDEESGSTYTRHWVTLP